MSLASAGPARWRAALTIAGGGEGGDSSSALHYDTRLWSVGDVERWVAELGLPEAAAQAASDGVDGRRLLELTSSEWQQIGVKKLGQRKLLLKAVEQLHISMRHHPDLRAHE
eukprot:SAG11_NODE_1018_length_6160_cov_2.345818_3_plen_112_part_00